MRGKKRGGQPVRKQPAPLAQPPEVNIGAQLTAWALKKAMPGAMDIEINGEVISDADIPGELHD